MFKVSRPPPLWAPPGFSLENSWPLLCIACIIWDEGDKDDMYVDESHKISWRTGTITEGELPHFSTPSALIVLVMCHFHTPNGAPRIAKQHFVLMGNGVHTHTYTRARIIYVVRGDFLASSYRVVVVVQTCSSLSTLATRPWEFLPTTGLSARAYALKIYMLR